MTPFIFSLRVYIEDTDYAGVIYHANYLNYFERARSEWAEQLGFGMSWQREQHIYFPVRSIQIDFLKPGRVHDQVEVVTEIKDIRHASLIYQQHLRHLSSRDTILCTAETKVACVNHVMRPQALPDLVKHLLTVET